MTFQEATLQLPTWVQIWLNILLLGAFILPLVLLIWKQTRLAGALTLIASLISAFVIMKMYDSLGMVRLLGLPHVILWTPAVIYLLATLRKPGLPSLAKWIIRVTCAIIVISLAFDYIDVIRYFLGDTDSLITRTA